jgi:hypothetical protein
MKNPAIALSDIEDAFWKILVLVARAGEGFKMRDMYGPRCLTRRPSYHAKAAQAKQSIAQQRDHPAFPQAVILTVSFFLSPVIGLSCHRLDGCQRYVVKPF